MTKEEFTIYVQAIIDMESEKGELNGSLKLIKEALGKVNETTPSPTYPQITNSPLPYYPGLIGVPNTSPDWTYRPEHQPYYTVTCTTNTTQQK
jgi:hypothetical protein